MLITLQPKFSSEDDKIECYPPRQKGGIPQRHKHQLFLLGNQTRLTKPKPGLCCHLHKHPICPFSPFCSVLIQYPFRMNGALNYRLFNWYLSQQDMIFLTQQDVHSMAHEVRILGWSLCDSHGCQRAEQLPAAPAHMIKFMGRQQVQLTGKS